MRWIILFIACGLIISSSLWQSTAQAEWTVWLHEPEAGRLLHLDADGAVLATQRIRPAPNHNLPEVIIIASSGDRAAYVTQNRDTLAQQLTVLDLPTGNRSHVIDLPPLAYPFTVDDELILSRNSFHRDGTSLAYLEKIGGAGWTLHLLDLDNEDTSYSLRHDDPLTSFYPPLHANAPLHIQNVSDDGVLFTLSTAHVPQQHNYQWRYQSNDLVETRAAPRTNAAVLNQTGEIASPLPDWRFSARHAELDTAYQQANTLHIYDPISDGRFPFYADERLDFNVVWFVQSGERLLAEAYFDALNTWWIVIDRRGSELERMPRAGYDVVGTPDGFVYATRIANQTAVLSVNTRIDADQTQTLWIDDGEWRIVWALLGTPEGELPRWSQLAVPEPAPLASQPGATPTLLPTPLPVLRAGMVARVQTQEDEFLNMRDAPTLNGAVLALLEDGVQIILVDGPVAAEGFVWWQIRIGGRLGWVVEALDDIQTIVVPEPQAAADDGGD